MGDDPSMNSPSPSLLQVSDTSSDAPPSLAADPVANDQMELNAISSQSPRPDENDNTEANDTEDTATVTGQERDSTNGAAMGVHTVEADNRNLSLPPKPMIKHPGVCPISNEQPEIVKSLYDGVVILENECIEIHKRLLRVETAKTSLDGEQYDALFELHGSLIRKHCHFFLASTSPTELEVLHGFAEEHAMPRRMWSHAICKFLEVLRQQLPESREFMDCFILQAYETMSCLEKEVPRFLSTWVKCKRDLSRYAMVAILEQGQSDPVPTFLLFTKSLVVNPPNPTPYILAIINQIVARNEETAEASVPQTDNDHFLAAIAYIILASLEHEGVRRNSYILKVDEALGKIGGPATTPRIRPSAELGLLLCLLLLGIGIPSADKTWSPMMATGAPDFMTAEDQSGSATMVDAKVIYNATIKLIDIMVPYLLKEADTRHLGVWGFIYVILVFMRSLERRPALLVWIGPAFHAKVLAPFLNMLLRERETRGGLEGMVASPLPEDDLLSGLFFAREAEPGDKSLEQKGLLRDLPLFPIGWVQKPENKINVLHHMYVQNVEMYYYRSERILDLAAHLKHFFVFTTHEEGNGWFRVPGASSIPKPDPNKKMPEIIKRNGASVVYVDPHAKERLSREWKRQEEEKDTKTTTDVATVIDKAEGDAQCSQHHSRSEPVHRHD